MVDGEVSAGVWRVVEVGCAGAPVSVVGDPGGEDVAAGAFVGGVASDGVLWAAAAGAGGSAVEARCECCHGGVGPAAAAV